MGAKSTEPSVVRRAPVIGSRDDARERILQGAIRSIARHGLERTSIASIAREAGTSRQTIYTYFSNREELVRGAVGRAATELTDRVVREANKAASGADYIVELTVGIYHGAQSHPAISSMLYSLDTPEGRELTMSVTVRSIVANILAPLVEREPSIAPRLDEIAETCLRFTVSLLTYPSERTVDPDALQTYVRNALVRLVGLPL